MEIIIKYSKTFMLTKNIIFKTKLMKNKKVNYIRINIFPDGGISRIRAFGRV